VRAEGVNFRTEFKYTDSDTDSTSKTTGQVAKTQFSEFKQLYDIDIIETFYPNLAFSAGSFFELNDTEFTSQGTETKTEETVIRPFAELTLDSPIHTAGIAYHGSQTREQTTGLPDTKNFRNEFDAHLGWRPEAFPELKFRYNHTHRYDDPETVDRTDKEFNFQTNYRAWDALQLDYDYTRTEGDNKITDFETLEQTHNGKIAYSHRFFEGRLAMSSDYRIRYNTFEFPTAMTTDAPLLRSQGLSGVNDDPADGPALSINNALIDGNGTVSAGLDIGLAGDETLFTNLGLDFGFSVDVDKIFIWVDRRLSSSVASSFSWSIYTSPDNTDTSTWTLAATVSPASFGTFENRFEISFSTLNTQFIKVVTNPLSPVVPDAASFPNIFVTEIEAFVAVSGETVQKRTTTDQNGSLNLRGRLGDQTFLGYNLYYSSKEEDPSSSKRTELSNGMSLHHVFNRVFAGSARVSHRDREEDDDKVTRYDYAASLSAGYLRTLSQTLSYSGNKEDEDDGSSSRDTVVLRTNAKLYPGWTAFLDTTQTWDRPLGRPKRTNTTIRTGTNVVPHQKLTVNGNYQTTKTREENNDDTTESKWDVQVFFMPLGALSLNFKLSVVDREDSKSTLENYSASWSPFPDGTLQFFFTYTETIRPESEQEARTISPSMKWQIGRHALLDMSYNITETETSSQITDSNSLIVNLRLVF
jgi:hypothetical protein